jgi:hypothetical protein
MAGPLAGTREVANGRLTNCHAAVVEVKIHLDLTQRRP